MHATQTTWLVEEEEANDTETEKEGHLCNYMSFVVILRFSSEEYVIEWHLQACIGV